MARRHADIRTAIWQDNDWRRLSVAAQWLYVLLISQPDLNQLGVLALRPTRWAALAGDANIGEALKELEEARFVVTDDEAGELLVRTYVRNDEVWRKPNLMLAAEAQLAEVASAKILAVLRQELVRLHPYATALPESAGRDGRPVIRPVTVLERMLERLPEPSPERSLEPIEEPPTRAGGRGPTAPLPPVPLSPAPRPPAEPTVPRTTAQTVVANWIDHCVKRPPGKVIGHVAKIVGELLAEGTDPDDIRQGLDLWQRKGLHPSTLASVVNEAMNSSPYAVVKPKPSTTDAKLAQTLSLLGQYERQELTSG